MQTQVFLSHIMHFGHAVIDGSVSPKESLGLTPWDFDHINSHIACLVGGNVAMKKTPHAYLFLLSPSRLKHHFIFQRRPKQSKSPSHAPSNFTTLSFPIALPSALYIYVLQLHQTQRPHTTHSHGLVLLAIQNRPRAFPCLWVCPCFFPKRAWRRRHIILQPWVPPEHGHLHSKA